MANNNTTSVSSISHYTASKGATLTVVRLLGGEHDGRMVTISGKLNRYIKYEDDLYSRGTDHHAFVDYWKMSKSEIENMEFEQSLKRAGGCLGNPHETLRYYIAGSVAKGLGFTDTLKALDFTYDLVKHIWWIDYDPNDALTVQKLDALSSQGILAKMKSMPAPSD